MAVERAVGRDLLIGAPVFWVRDAVPAIACMMAALLVWFTPRRLWSDSALDWLDAVGLAAFAVYGAAKAMSYGVPPLVAALMGVVTRSEERRVGKEGVSQSRYRRARYH